MKRFLQRSISFLLALLLIVPAICTDNIALAAETKSSSYSPYAKISYDYSTSVQCGTIRYISQKSNSAHFNKNYWGKYLSEAGWQCGIASSSMALSYIGVNKTPETLLAENNGVAAIGIDRGAGKSDRTSTAAGLKKFMDNYINGNGKYSPVVINIYNYINDGNPHMFVLIGKVKDNVYEVLDPCETYPITQISFNGETGTYKIGNSSYTKEFSSAFQWYNANAKINNIVTKPTITGYNTPGTLNVGNFFGLKGDVNSSGANLTNVTAGVYDMNNKMLTGKSVNPGSSSYSITKIDPYVVFNDLNPGVYTYKISATNSAGTTTVNKVFAVLSNSRTIADGSYRISPQDDSNYVLGIAGNSDNDKGNLVLQTNQSNNNYQVFNVKYSSNGYYTIQNSASGKFIDVDNASSASETNVWQYQWTGSKAQYWQILWNGTSWHLIPQCATANALDIYGGKFYAGANLDSYTVNTSKAQTFAFNQATTHTHSYTGKVTTSATCTKNGVKTFTCSCGNSYTESIPALHHNYSSEIEIPVTCTRDGRKGYSCSRCGDYYTEKIPAPGHQIVILPGEPATCSYYGMSDGQKCTVCRMVLVPKEMTYPLGHSMDSEKIIKPATCKEEGVKTSTCTVCGWVKKRTIEKTDDHNWDSGIITQQPSVTKMGVKTYTCVICGQTRTEELEKLMGQENNITAKNFAQNASTKAQSFSIGAKVLDNAKLTYKSDNKSITVDKNGKVTVAKNYAGKATITITAAKTSKYAATTKKITVTVNKLKQPMTVSPTSKTYKVSTVKKKAQSFTIKLSKAQGTVSYKSNNTKYVTVKKGKVTIKKGTPKGTYKITVTAKGNANYNAGSKTVTITVK